MLSIKMSYARSFKNALAFSSGSDFDGHFLAGANALYLVLGTSWPKEIALGPTLMNLPAFTMRVRRGGPSAFLNVIN